MAFGTGDRRKADVAEGVAVAVGHAATRRGNRLGVVAFGSESSVEPPRQGRRALLASAAHAARGAAGRQRHACVTRSS